MDDLKFPDMSESLPPPEPIPTDMYARWVLEQVRMMYRDGRARFDVMRNRPVGERFMLG